MAKLATVADLITEARRIVQDENGDRWPDVNFYQALNVGLAEAYRLRPDLFRSSPDEVPQFDTSQGAEPTPISFMYIPAILLFLCGWVQLTDDEGTEDQRAAAMMTALTMKLCNHVS